MAAVRDESNFELIKKFKVFLSLVCFTQSFWQERRVLIAVLDFLEVSLKTKPILRIQNSIWPRILMAVTYTMLLFSPERRILKV